MANPMQTPQPVFDRTLIRRRRARASHRSTDPHKNYDFLHQWAAKEMAGRLSIVKRTFPLALQIGTRCTLPLPDESGIENLLSMDNVKTWDGQRRDALIGDEEFLPFAPQSLDLAIHLMGLHTVNDSPGTLIQLRRALKPDGLFMGAMFGGETLYQLRDVLTQAEMEICGGLSPRIAPFADKQQMGALMQRAGFALPVVDSELLTVTYDSIFRLFEDLRGMGETAAMYARAKTIPPRQLFARAAELYAQRYAGDDGRIEATFEIIFLSGWAPHESQQKPLRPGSADHSLAEVLNTQENPC